MLEPTFIGAGFICFTGNGLERTEYTDKNELLASRVILPDLKSRRNELFGKSFAERILKDYNSQTYWISANISSF